MEKEESPFVFYSSSNEAGVAGFLADHGLRQGVIPAGHDARRVIDLRDLSAINSELSGDCLFLPLIYSVSSIYLAAQVVLAEGNIDQIEDKLAQTTLRALYQSLFGRPLSEDEWQQLFRGELLPPLEKLTGTLNSLHLAIIQVEKAA